MAELLEEIVAQDESAAEDTDAQQRFQALAFPAKHGAQVIKHLTTAFGSLVDMGFAHLKRMKKHDLVPQQLIALIVPVASDSAVSDEQLQELQSQFNGSLCEVQVLKRPPKTRECWELHTKNWPLIFHASVAPETQVEPITDDQAHQMKRILEQAVAYGDRLRADHAGEQLGFCCASGCVIADPSGSCDGTAYAAVADSFTRHSLPQYSFRSLFHPVMVAIDAVAARDRARDGYTPSKKPRRAESCATTTKASDARAIKEVNEVDGSEEDDNDSVSASASIATITESYLCTGYDVFVDVEPCVMCAMALVHSRARRVVFATRNPTDGALASVHQLHTIKSLNHHYRVFYLPLPQHHGKEAAATAEL